MKIIVGLGNPGKGRPNYPGNRWLRTKIPGGPQEGSAEVRISDARNGRRNRGLNNPSHLRNQGGPMGPLFFTANRPVGPGAFLASGKFE